MLYLLKFVAWLKFIKITCLPPCFYLYLTFLNRAFLKQGFCPFCLPSQLSYTAAFTALRCEQVFLNSMQKQPYTFFFCINSNHENCEKEMFLFLFSHCCSMLSAWHSATRPRQLAALGVWQLQFKRCFLGCWPCTRLGRERWEAAASWFSPALWIYVKWRAGSEWARQGSSCQEEITILHERLEGSRLDDSKGESVGGKCLGSHWQVCCSLIWECSYG